MTLLLLFLFCSLWLRVCSVVLSFIVQCSFPFNLPGCKREIFNNSNVNGLQWPKLELCQQGLVTQISSLNQVPKNQTVCCAIWNCEITLFFIFPRNWCSQLFARFHAGTLRWSRSSTSKITTNSRHWACTIVSACARYASKQLTTLQF